MSEFMRQAVGATLHEVRTLLLGVGIEGEGSGFEEWAASWLTKLSDDRDPRAVLALLVQWAQNDLGPGSFDGLENPEHEREARFLADQIGKLELLYGGRT